MYYFYLIESVRGRAGFGITQDPQERNRQYTSHAGDTVKFVFLYGGHRPHAKALERTIKKQYIDNLWVLGEWKTEWLNDSVTMSDLHNYVKELISERHFRLKLVAEDYDFSQELNVL